MQIKSVPRLRLLDEAYAELKRLDPKTSVSKNHIRSLAVSGKIPVVMAGRRRLINMDGLIEYLNSETFSEQQDFEFGKVRRVI